jgi:hypothetical protein
VKRCHNDGLDDSVLVCSLGVDPEESAPLEAGWAGTGPEFSLELGLGA